MVQVHQVPLAATPSDILWIDELRVVVALPKSFSIIHVQSGLIQDVFSTYSSFKRTTNKHLVSLMDDSGLLLTKDGKNLVLLLLASSFHVELDTYMTQDKPLVEWSGIPDQVCKRL